DAREELRHPRAHCGGARSCVPDDVEAQHRHVARSRLGGREGGAEVLERSPRLGCDVATTDWAAFLIASRLPGHEHESTGCGRHALRETETLARKEVLGLNVLQHRRHPPKCATAARASMNHTATVETR